MKLISTFPASMLGAVALLAAFPIQASPNPGPTLSGCTQLAGTNGLVTITECAFSNGPSGSSGGTYGIQVNGSGVSIDWFAVSTNNLASYDTGELLPFTSRNIWASRYLTSSFWDKYYVETTEKSFSELFGSDAGVYVFGINYGDREYKDGIPLSSGDNIQPNTLTFGWNGGSPNSHFAAFNGTTIVSQSITSAVPEPSGYALMLAGMGVLGALARRRRTA